MANWTPESRIEEILFDTINGEEYNGLPESRVEELLLELKEVIEAGGGGGGGTSTIAWKPSVALDGTISWTRTASETKPDDQNIKGPKGDDGEDGEDGLGIKQVSINLENHLIITYDDDTTEDAGALPGVGSTTLSGLTDTAIESPAEAQPLTYDDASGKWINGGIIPTANGGTGNNTGYIHTGARANNTIGNNSTIEGYDNVASGQSSHAEGHSTVASGNYGAHAEGSSTTASGTYSHAEGLLSRATHNYAHAEGSSVASAQAAHSEGEGSTASAFCAHAGGNYGAASGSCSFSHGSYTNATAECSVAMGRNTNAGYVDQFAVGKYNDNKSTSIFEVGIGTGSGGTPRINGLELDTSGNLKVASAITSGGNIVSNGFIDDGHGHRLGYSKRSKIDPFPEGASAITLYNTNGVTISSSSIDDGVGSLTATESQAGYEGFVIELNVTPGKFHVVSFDYQNVDCEYWTNPTFMLGWTLNYSAKTDYQNIGLWSNNIERNTILQHFEGTITTSGNKVYLNFNVCGYSDSRSNTFSLSNLTVYELVEDTGEPDALTDLSDTAISSPADGQILGYNGTSGKWKNTTLTIPDISVKQNITLTTPLSIGGVSRSTVESALGALAEQASYLEQTVTLSTSASTTVTFTDSNITANSFIEYACSQWDLVPESITGAAGSCTVVLPKVDSAQSVTVRIYVR